jgi:exodeoxyribonuclease III
MVFVCAYFPNGQALDSEKFQYKMRWIASLHKWLAELKTGSLPVALLGDFNIAPDDRDVHDPVLWAGQLHCSPQEREWFVKLVELGFVDTFRAFEQVPRLFSWWDYRQLGFRRNAGLRIDVILLDDRLSSRLSACRIDKEPRRLEQPSDHAPVIATLA